MVLKLYGLAFSGNIQRVTVVLHEKQVPYELVTVDLYKGAHKTPEYLEKHPFGQIPYLDDDGFILFESRAIARYIAIKYADQGTKLIPSDLKGRALFEQAASIEKANFDSYARTIVFEKWAKKLRGLETDEEAVKAAITSLEDKLDVYDKILSKQKYLGGDEITLADLFHLPGLDKFGEIGVGYLIDNRPNVKRWFEDLSSRSSWQSVKADSKLP
ncbi:glutathione S-transferase-like protein [Amanita muscaria]